MTCAPSPFTIFLGDAKTLNLKVANSGQGADPVDLTDCTEIIINLPNADGSTLQLKLTLTEVVVDTPAVLGKFHAPISSGDSALLNVGELQSFDVTFTIGSQVFTVPYLQALSVFQVS